MVILLTELDFNNFYLKIKVRVIIFQSQFLVLNMFFFEFKTRNQYPVQKMSKMEIRLQQLVGIPRILNC